MIVDYDSIQLKNYKGYEIWKIWDIDAMGKRKNVQYEVADDDNAIDFFDTLSEAKKYIDTVLA